MTALEPLMQQLYDKGVRRARIALADLDGILRGKYVSLEKFASAAVGGLGFCDVVFGWDMADALYDNATFTGWHTGYPDAQARIDLDTFRLIPWEPATAFFLMDLRKKDGAPLTLAPRQVFRGVLDRCESMGFRPTLAAEYEFWIFRETPQSLRDKNFRNLTPLTPGMFGYSVLRASENSALVVDLMDQLAGFDIPLESFHTETGPGVYEAAIALDHGMAAADKATLFKTTVKEIVSRHGLTATFMAKWNADLPGAGGHIHQSLTTPDGRKNLFHSEGEPYSELMRHYLGGLVKYLPELMAMLCPTINSYKRTVPGTWAPVNATWGVDNRTTAVRAIPGSAKSTRIELRLSGADMNPYLAMAASLAAGLEGVAHHIEPAAPVSNAYASSQAPPLPSNLAEATRLFRGSDVARTWFGEEFVEHYAGTREWEIRQFERSVTDWELARYFESI